MLEKMGTQYREAFRLANEAHQLLIRMGPEHPEDKKIHAAVEKALKGADLGSYCSDVELNMDAPRYDDSLDETVSACCEFSLSIRGIEDGDYNKIVRALRPLGLGRPLDHAKPDAVEYKVDLR